MGHLVQLPYSSRVTLKYSAQNCIQTYFFKDLAEAKGQPAINLKGIFFLSSPLDLIKS